jgi:hypothetical protein
LLTAIKNFSNYVNNNFLVFNALIKNIEGLSWKTSKTEKGQYRKRPKS